MFVGVNYVNGEFGQHSADFASINPANEKQLGMFPITKGKGVDEAVDAARCAFNTWRELSRVKRGEYFDNLAQIMKKEHDRLVETITLETGKTLNEAHAEVTEARHMVEYVVGMSRMPYGEVIASEVSEKDAYTFRKPKGVVAIVSPWNFPMAIGGFWNAAPAIAEGNCVVWKPSELTPMCAQVVTELYDQAGFPPGVFNLIHGMDKTGEELVHNQVDCILFTGSAEVGMLIRQHCASTWHKTCACEMGSKSAVVLFDDANMNLAIDACIASAFKLSGQRCVSSGRMIVQRSRLDEFTSLFVERAGTLKVGDPMLEDGLFYGPMISAEQMLRVQDFNRTASGDPDADVLMNGVHVGDKGYCLSPHVYGMEWADKITLKNEVFGPHVAIIPFDDVDEGIDIYNDTKFALAVGIITDNFKIARRCRTRMDYGMGYWNGSSIGAESHLPFSGLKASGNSRPSAAHCYRSVTDEVSWTVNHEDGLTFCQGMDTK